MEIRGEQHAGEVLERIAEIARALAEAESLDDTLQRVVDLGKAYLEGCDDASMMFIRRGHRVTSPAFTSDMARDADTAQYEAGEGPCLSSMDEHATLIIEDLRTDDRWPRFRELGLGLGVRSMISFRLFVAEDTMGALNFMATRPAAFDETSQMLGQIFASHAAVAIKSAIAEAGLHSALTTRDVIGQAKGIIMNEQHVTAEQAFGRLREMSQQLNRPIRDVAQDIAETGRTPGRSGS